jgi:haloacetate dehalogenase
MLHVWQQFAQSVQGTSIRAGHYLAEEAPDQVLAQLLPFLTASGVERA